MKKLRLYAAAVLAFTVWICSPAAAQTIEIGYIEFPPMTYTNEQGQAAGCIIDIASKTLEKAGYKWSAQSLPTKRMAKMIVEGDIHLWIGLPTLPEFEDRTYVGNAVVKKLFFRAYTIGKMEPVLRPEDLKGRTVLLLRGYSYGGWINFIKNPENNIRYIEFDSHEEAFKGLSLYYQNGISCCLLNYKHPSETILKEKEISDIHFNDIAAFNIHFVVTRKMQDAKGVLDQIENAFSQLQEQGVFL